LIVVGVVTTFGLLGYVASRLTHRTVSLPPAASHAPLHVSRAPSAAEIAPLSATELRESPQAAKALARPLQSMQRSRETPRGDPRPADSVAGTKEEPITLLNPGTADQPRKTGRMAIHQDSDRVAPAEHSASKQARATEATGAMETAQRLSEPERRARSARDGRRRDRSDRAARREHREPRRYSQGQGNGTMMLLPFLPLLFF
jgi:hypothetical protein